MTTSVEKLNELFNTAKTYWVCPVTGTRIDSADAAAIAAHKDKVIKAAVANEFRKSIFNSFVIRPVVQMVRLHICHYRQTGIKAEKCSITFISFYDKDLACTLMGVAPRFIHFRTNDKRWIESSVL